MMIRERLERELERELAAMRDRNSPRGTEIHALLRDIRTGVVSPGLLEAVRRMQARRV